MRLICPSCSAEYEVAAEAVGTKGRMVRCAACASEWFQSPSHGGAKAEPVVSAPEPPAATEPADRGLSALGGFDDDYDGDFDNDFADTPGTPDAQPAAMTAKQKAETQSALERLSSFADDDDEPVQQVYHDVDPARQSSFEPVVDETVMASRRKEEMDELKASLISENDEQSSGAGGSFLLGFAVMTLIAMLMIFAYAKAPEIAQGLPAIKEPLTVYVDMIDQGRLALAQATNGGV